MYHPQMKTGKHRGNDIQVANAMTKKVEQMLWDAQELGDPQRKEHPCEDLK